MLYSVPYPVNTALDKALRDKGFSTFRERQKLALDLGMSDRTINRWVAAENQPNEALGRVLASHLKVKYDDLWPKERAA